jgi:hypothetical protein
VIRGDVELAVALEFRDDPIGAITVVVERGDHHGVAVRWLEIAQ